MREKRYGRRELRVRSEREGEPEEKIREGWR